MNKLDTNNTQVILIGITTYEDKNLHSLKSAFDNVAKLRERLLSESIGIPKTNINEIINPSNKTRLLKQLKDYAKKEGTNNLILYYSGHGVLDDSENFYLALSNSTVEEIYPDGLSIVDLNHIFSNFKLNIILILDCCFSERAFEKFTLRNYCVLASSAKNETSKYPDGEEFSAFTKELIDVLNNGIDVESDYLSLKDIFKEIEIRLDNKGLPKPKIANTNSIEDLYFARNNFKAKVIKKNNNPSFNQEVKELECALEKALHGFNYTDQKKLFDDYLEKRNVGSVIIHGKNDYGQKWLFNTLLSLYKIHSYVNLLHPSNYGKESNFEGILETLKEEFSRSGGKIRFQREDSLESKTIKIVNHICQMLSSGENVIILFRNLFKLMPKDNKPFFLNDFFNKFWLIMAKQTEEIIRETKQKCLLFFIEDEEISDNLYGYCSKEIEEFENKFLLLPAIQPLCENTLYDWIDYIKSFECIEIRNKFRKYTLEDCKEYLTKCIKKTHIALFDEIYYEFNLDFKEC